MSRQLHDSSHLNSSRGRRDHSLGRRGSEAGSFRGVYGHDSGSRSVGNVRESNRESNDGFMIPTTEEAKWIHRDKLAKIESEELQQAALFFHRRTGDSKSSRGRSHISGSSSVGSPPMEHTEPWPELQEEEYDDARSSNAFDGNGTTTTNTTGNGVDDERKTWDLRRPEEIAAEDDGFSGFYRNPALRKSSSKIPIPTTSPAPILPDQVASRSRATTAADDDAASISMPRRASEPFAVDRDTPPLPATSTPPSGSRPNSRGAQTAMQSVNGRKPAGAKGAGSTTRKTSAPPASRKTTPKSRTTSGTNNTQRPTTRGESRPNTAVNRPEGDPPWLATMYKPDPRLPPDQQIIPTHARQIQQEQWEKEGKTPTTYDREFAPLAISPDKSPTENKEPSPAPAEPSQPPQPPPKTETEGSTWPLAAPQEPEKRLSNVSGYSPMPKVQDPTQGRATPKWSPPVVTAEQESPKEKKAGCGCCVVM